MKLIYIFLLLLIPQLVHGQIRTTTTSTVQTTVNTEAVFDSTSNFLGNNVNAYIGKSLFVRGNHRKENYRGFILDYNESSSNYDNTYLPAGSSYYNMSNGSSYEELVGKYFEVVDVIPHPRQGDSSLFENSYYLKLIDKSNNQTLYFEYRSNFESSFPFITVGFFERENERLTGNKYVLKKLHYTSYFHSPTIQRKPQIDILTGDNIIASLNEVWECIGITLWEENDYQLAYELKNSSGQIMLLSYNAKDPSTGLFTLEESVYYTQKFGSVNFSKVLSGEVSTGMTEEMILLSVGPPRSINETITNNLRVDQWVYSGERYLYFRNGVLSTIQGSW